LLDIPGLHLRGPRYHVSLLQTLRLEEGVGVNDH